MPRPEGFQIAARPVEGEAAAAEFALHGERLWRVVAAAGDGRFEPDKKFVDAIRVERMAAQFRQRAVAQLVGDEERAIGGDAHKASAGAALRLGEVIRHLGQHVADLMIEILLVFQYGVAEQRIGPTANRRHAHFVVQLPVIGAEAFAQQRGDGDADSLVARARGQVRKEFGQIALPPKRIHGSRIAVRAQARKRQG